MKALYAAFIIIMSNPANAQHLLEISQPSKPSWIDSPPAPTSQWFFFVGSCIKTSTREKGKDIAYKQALSQIAQTVNLSLYQKYLERKTETTTSVNKNVVSEIQTRAQAQISGAIIKEVYWEKYRAWKYWVLRPTYLTPVLG